MRSRSVYSYSNYRQFLNDVFLQEKASGEGTTLAKFAKLFGMSAPAFKMVTDGSRNLTVHNLHHIARGLKLSEPEHCYFEALVLRDQAANSFEKNFYYRRLKRLKEQDQPNAAVRVTTSKLVSRWYYPALLIYLIDIENVAQHTSTDQIDVKTIANKFQLSTSEVKSAIEYFEELGLLQATTGEKLHLVFEKITRSYPQQQYLRGVFAEGMKRLNQNFQESDRVFLKSHTFSLPYSEIVNLRTAYNQLIERFMALASVPTQQNDSRKVDKLEVMQANIQVYPVCDSQA